MKSACLSFFLLSLSKNTKNAFALKKFLLVSYVVDCRMDEIVGLVGLLSLIENRRVYKSYKINDIVAIYFFYKFVNIS